MREAIGLVCILIYLCNVFMFNGRLLLFLFNCYCNEEELKSNSLTPLCLVRYNKKGMLNKSLVKELFMIILLNCN